MPGAYEPSKGHATHEITYVLIKIPPAVVVVMVVSVYA